MRRRAVRRHTSRPWAAGRPAPGGALRILLFACSFALTEYAGVRLLAGDWFGVALWFVGAAVVHDFVLLPLYALADRAVAGVLDAGGRRKWTMYVRVPAALSGLLLLVWFPLISGRVAERYESATGMPGDVFLGRWLLLTAGLFAGSALLLVLRLRRVAKARPPAVH